MTESELHIFKVYLRGGQIITFKAEQFIVTRMGGAYESYEIKGLEEPRMISFNLGAIDGWEQVR